jgi:hypothetical protein
LANFKKKTNKKQKSLKYGDFGPFFSPKKINPMYEFAAPFLSQSCKNSPPKTNSAHEMK